MPRRWRTGLVLVATVVAFAAGCSGSSEKKLLGDFFRASRLRDDLTLGNFATATFDPRTDGIVESFDVTSVGDEKVTPLPLKQYVKDIEDAKAREDWGWSPAYDFDRAFDEYLVPTIRKRYG